MEVRFLLQLVRAHWVFLVALTVTATVLGLLATYIIDEKYEATAKILIRPQQATAFDSGSKEMMDYPVSFNLPAEAISQTFAEIMVSKAVATRVVDILQLHTRVAAPDPRWYVREFYSARDWVKQAAKDTWELLQYGRIDRGDPYWNAVRRVRKHLEADPVADTYIFTLTASLAAPDLSAHVANTAASVFVEYSRKARQGEEGSAADLLSEGVVQVREQLDLARSRLDEFRTDVHVPSLDQELGLKLDALSEFESDLAAARTELAGLQAKFTQTHPDVRSLIARIERLEETVGAYRTDVLTLGTHQGELARLELEVGILEDSYRLVTHDHEEARWAAMQAISEIRVLHEAIPPLYPEGPIKIYYAGGGLLLGLLTGVAFLLLSEYVEQRIRSEEDVEEGIGVAVLATVPHAPLPARAAALLGGPGVSSSDLAWKLLAGDSMPTRAGDAPTEH